MLSLLAFASVGSALFGAGPTIAARADDDTKLVSPVYILDDLAPDQNDGKTNYRVVFRTAGDIRVPDAEGIEISSLSLEVPGMRAVGDAKLVQPIGKKSLHCWSVLVRPAHRKKGSQTTELRRKKNGTRLKVDFVDAAKAKQRVTATVDSTPGPDATSRYKDRYKKLGCPLS